MNKLCFKSIFVCFLSISTFALSGDTLDFSECYTFYDVCNQLTRSVSHMDIRIEKANMLLNSDRFINNHKNEFPGLRRIREAKYQSLVKTNGCYGGTIDFEDEGESHFPSEGEGNIVCEVDVELGFLESYFLLENRLAATQEIYASIRDLAIQQINHLLTDENIEVVLHVVHGERKNGKWETTKEPIAKWEKGVASYYEKFMGNL